MSRLIGIFHLERNGVVTGEPRNQSYNLGCSSFFFPLLLCHLQPTSTNWILYVLVYTEFLILKLSANGRSRERKWGIDWVVKCQEAVEERLDSLGPYFKELIRWRMHSPPLWERQGHGFVSASKTSNAVQKRPVCLSSLAALEQEGVPTGSCSPYSHLTKGQLIASF